MAKEEEISENLFKVIRGLNKRENEDKTSVSKIKTKITFKESLNHLFILYMFHKNLWPLFYIFNFQILNFKKSRPRYCPRARQKPHDADQEEKIRENSKMPSSLEGRV